VFTSARYVENRHLAVHSRYTDVLPLVQVKPNVGHSEGASGLTSLIKTVLALEHSTIPPQANFADPNPKSEFASNKSHDAATHSQFYSPLGRVQSPSLNKTIALAQWAHTASRRQ